MRKMKIAVLGTQASGKGTQAQILSSLMGVPAVSVGDLLRDLQNEASDRGRAAKQQMSKGSFVADDVIMPLLREWIAAHPDGWIVDGFPRSLEQAKACADFFKPDAVVYLEVPDEISHRRISFRRVCAQCRTNYNLITQPPKNPKGVCDLCGGELVRRADDTPELVTERLRIYHEVTEPVKSWYAARKSLILIDGRPSVPDVAREVEFRLEQTANAADRRKRLRRWFWISLAVLAAVCVGLTAIGFILEP